MEAQRGQKQSQHPKENLSKQQSVDRIVLDYYTDPLCCWSWAIDKSLERLEHEFGDRLSVRYIMGGMLRTWDAFNDPYNDINRPIQMAPMWMHASNVTNAVYNTHIWHNDPPASSYPACIAVKTAGLQAPQAEKKYLFRVREAVMTRGLNIARTAVLHQIADEVAAEIPEHFSTETFKKDWQLKAGYTPFENDLQKVASHRISRFPTLLMKGNEKAVVGFRTWEELIHDLGLEKVIYQSVPAEMS